MPVAVGDPLVRFPAFRHHEMARREANSAIMALLVGSQMTAHFLSLTVGSQHLLPAMFPAVSHVRRFNLTSDKAREVLLNADAHLGTMAVPYALAIHEDFLRTCLELLGIISEPPAARLHATLASHAGGGFDSDSLAQFHVLREMRNAVIHLGGRVDQRLVGCANRLSPSAETAWKKVAGRSPRRLVPDDVVELGTGELFLSLAATKNLARQANKMLVPALPASEWASVILQDFRDNGPANVQQPQRWRKLRGWRRFHYSATRVSDADLTAAAARHGLAL